MLSNPELRTSFHTLQYSINQRLDVPPAGRLPRRNRPKLDVLTILAKRAGLIGVTRQEVASTDAAGGPRCPALGAAALEAAHP